MNHFKFGYKNRTALETRWFGKRESPTGCSALEPSTSIDFYAAPEVVGAFRAAGFTDDVKRINRNAEILNPETGKLESVDYELTALTFSLGEI